MMKKSGFVGIALSALALSGCGGGSGNGESQITTQLKQKDAIVIIHGTKESACSLLADQMTQLGAKGVIYASMDNTITCATFGKVEGSIDDPNAQCAIDSLANFSNSQDISLLEDTSKACVIGGNN